MKRLIPAILLILSASAVPSQQPKVTDTQFRVEPMGQSLAATIENARHSGDQLWLAYEIAALPGHHISACSDWQNSSDSEDECCGEYRLEDENHLNRNGKSTAPQNLYVLLRFD